jgi:hypothetical protein
MFRLKGVAKTMLVAINSMPLLTDHVARDGDFFYRYNTPPEDLGTHRHDIPSKTAIVPKSSLIPFWLEY